MSRKFFKRFISIFTIATILFSGFGKAFAEPEDLDSAEDITTSSGEIKWSQFFISRLKNLEKSKNEFCEVKPRESFSPKRPLKYYDGEDRWIDSEVIDERQQYDKILETLQNIESEALNRKVSLNELSNISEKDQIKVVKGIYEWIIKNINYCDLSMSKNRKKSSNKRSDQDAIATFYSKKAVCEGITNLTVMLARLAGIKAVDLVSLGDEDGLSHAFPAVYLNDNKSEGREGWVIFDPTWAISGFNYFRLNCLNMNCDDFLKIFDINTNCKWDTGLILNNDKNIKWDFKILNSLKYIFDAYNFEHKNIFSGSNKYFGELADDENEGISLKKILDVVSLKSDDEDVVKEVSKYLSQYGVNVEELKKVNVFDIEHVDKKISDAINNYLEEINSKYEKLEKDGYNWSTPKISCFSIVKNTMNNDNSTRDIYVNYNLDLKHISTKKFFLEFARKNMNISNKNQKIEFNSEFKNFLQSKIEKNFPACYSDKLAFEDSNLKLLQMGDHTLEYAGNSPMEYFLEKGKYLDFFANISGYEENARLDIKHSLNNNIANQIKYLNYSMREYIDNDKKNENKKMLGKKRKFPDYYENLRKQKAKRNCINRLMSQNLKDYDSLNSFFEQTSKGIVLENKDDFQLPFLFAKEGFEFSDIFPYDFGSIKLEGKWKIDFSGSDVEVLKKLDFTNCNTYEKKGECIYEKAENGVKKLVFEFKKPEI